MRRLALAAVALSVLAGAAYGKDRDKDRGKDRVCTASDIARFEAMLGGLHKGQYRTDPRFQVTIHYLGTAIVKGTCIVALRPGD